MLMEDHQEAYFFWRDLGLKGATCVHVDAHLDVSNLKVPGYGLVDAPELNCANFLHRAIREEIVEHLVWVIPPHLPGGRSLLEWTRDELQNWMHLSLTDYSSLQAVAGRVEGTLAGARFTLCTTDTLPQVETALIDVDVDYYLGPEDEVWQSPLELHQVLAGIEPLAVTVAISVIGGYTPVHLRYLGDLTLLAFEEIESAREVAAQIEAGDNPDLPPWGRAAVEARAAVAAGEDHFGPGWDRAVARDAGFRANVFDAAAFYFMRGKHDLSRAWLERAEGDEVHYLAALMAMREGKDEVALQHLGILEAGGLALEPRNRAHLLELLGKCEARRGQPATAAQKFREALKLDSTDAPVWRELARAQRAAGDNPGAARSFRKAVTLAPEQLATAGARLELAELYASTGQPLLAKAELAALERPEMPSEYRLEAQRLGLRLAARR